MRPCSDFEWTTLMSVGRAEVQGARVRGQRTRSRQWLRHLGWRSHVSAECSDLQARLSPSHALPGCK